MAGSQPELPPRGPEELRTTREDRLRHPRQLGLEEGQAASAAAAGSHERGG